MAVSLSGLRQGLASFRREENDEDCEDEAYKLTIKNHETGWFCSSISASFPCSRGPKVSTPANTLKCELYQENELLTFQDPCGL